MRESGGHWRKLTKSSIESAKIQLVASTLPVDVAGNARRISGNTVLVPSSLASQVRVIGPASSHKTGNFTITGRPIAFNS